MCPEQYTFGFLKIQRLNQMFFDFSLTKKSFYMVGLGGIEPPSIAYQATVLTIVLQAEVAGGLGFEPRTRESKSPMLPLHHPPTYT